jgi:diguanylate cyclase (GGDEF)-like protein
MADGRWRRITEQPLPDGGVLAFSIDVTDLVDNQQALHDAHAQAEQAQLQLREAIEAMPAGVEVYDEHDRLVIFNQRLTRMYPHLADQMAIGHTFEELVRRSIEQGLVPAAEGHPEAWLAERIARRGHDSTPLLQQTHGGAWFHIHETRTASGAVVGVRLDVTELVQQREALRDAQARAESARETLDDAIEALPEGFALFDADDRLVLCNQRYRELYPASAPAIAAGQRFEDIVRYGLERGQYPQAAADPEAWLADRVHRHRHPSGEPLLQELPGNHWLRIDERKTRRGGIAGVRSDVSEMVRTRQQLEAVNARLETLSTTDALTGASNRRLFDEHLAEEMRRTQRHGQPLALLFIDIDHFKRYNDRYGHPAGDAALRRVATLLLQQARRPGDLAARYGGEEFALLLPHTDEVAAMVVAERCLAALTSAGIEHADSPTAPHLTLSIGVAAHRAVGTAVNRVDPPRHEDAAAFVARADAALYEAKQRGRARAAAARPQADG